MMKTFSLLKTSSCVGAAAMVALTGCSAGPTNERPPEQSTPPPSVEEVLFCPQEEQNFNALTLEGLSLQAAEDAARRYGCTVRTVQRDGERLAVTKDYLTNRVNVVTVDNKITRVESIG